MAQTGYTPIQLYSSSTTGNTPAAADLLNSTGGSELAINIFDGKLFYKDNAGAVQVIGWKVVPTTAGGTGQTTYTDGEILIGNSTGNTLTKTTLTAGANITITNAPGSITIAATGGGGSMVYPSAGIANSTGTAWGTSYTTSGTGTVLALATSPTFVTPVLGTPSSGTLTNCTGLPVGGISATGTPSSTTYLRGDGTWSTVAGGGVTSVTGTAPVVSSGGTTPAISIAAANTTTDGYLTSTDWNTFNNKQPAGSYVTSVGATSPVTSSGGTTPTIAMPAATTSVSGYLTSTDWNTFNNKQPAGSYLTAVTADAPLSGSGTSGSHLIISQANTTTNGYLSSTDWNTFNNKGNGTVTSVGFTGGIISVATATSTPAFTVAGTSGGIPYFSSATTWATSAALAAGALVQGGGAGVAPSTITTGTGVVTALGNNTGSAGSFVVNGNALGTPSSGTVTNLTGTASININGTVGGTTPTTGQFTTATANSFIPNLSTVPTNGMYLPASDNVGLSTASTNRFTIDSSGNLYAPNTLTQTSINIGIADSTVNAFQSTKTGSLVIKTRNSAIGAQGMAGSDLTLQAGNSYYGNNTADGNVYIKSGYNLAGPSVTAGYISFFTGSTLPEVARIFASGGLSLGNSTDPGATNLSVTGTTNSASFIPTSATVPTNGLYLPAANTVAIATNTTERLRINASGAWGLSGATYGTAGQVLISGGSSAAPTWATVGGLGTVTSVSGTGTVNGLTLTGTVTTIGSLTLGGTLDLSSPPAIGGTTASTGAFTYISTSSSTSTTPTLSFNASNSPYAAGATISGSYLQHMLQNKSATAGASTNYVLSNDSGTDSTFYGEFGMNSSVFSASTPADFFSINNGVYFSGHDGDITVGSGNGFKTYLAWGTTGQSAHVINASGAIGLNTNLGTTPALSGTNNFGTAGQKLQSAGSAATAIWASSPLATSFTTGTAATYTVPAGCTQLKITVQGPGGTGGASATGRATGGSAGSTCIKWLTVTPGGTLTYTVGTAAGTASTVSSGTITITTISAGSGSNGTSTAYAASLTAGTTGGAATGGDINIVGGRGGNSYGSSTTITTNFSGAGGNSPFGNGGQGLSMVATAGQAASGFGGGGGGAHGNATGGAATGGIIIFETY